MVFDRNAAYIIIVLTLPFQFNIITDSYNILKVEILKDWKTGRTLTYYENYFAEKITYYIGIITAICLVLIYYKLHKMRIVISVGFFFNAVTWFLYLLISEHRVFMFIIVRGLHGIFLSIFQMSHCVYLLHFSNEENTCFVGTLIVGSMFLGLLILNFLFYCCNWRAVTVICAVQSLIFCGLIWLAPEIRIKSRSQCKERIYDKNNRRSLFAMVFIMILQQLSGISILLGQLSRILVGIGLHIDSYLQSCLFVFVCALATFISAFISDYLGTRFIWSFSAFGLCVGLLIYGITLKVEMMDWVASLGIFVYFLFYGLGEGPIPWYLCGSLFKEELRIESSAITVCENFFFFPILPIIWESLNKNAGEFGSIIFCFVICFLSIFCGLLIPKLNRSLDEGINLL